MANLFTRFKNIPSKLLGNKLTKLNDISKGERVVKSAILQFYSANRNIGNYTPVLGIHQMLGQELDLWNIHKTPVDWDFVHKNYTEVIVGGAGLLHSVFEKFWVDLDKNCKLPITIWGIGVCLPDNDSVKGVPKAVVQSVFAKAKLANVRDELTRDFYQLDPKLSITACPTLVYIANNFKVADKQSYEKKVLHSSHVDLEPTSTTPQIKEIIKSAGYKYLFTENIETKKEGLKKILKMYQDCDYVVTTRLHGAIIAYAFKRPYIAISFDPKITAFNQLYGGGICISDVNQLAEALASEKFKVKSNYQRELDRVAEFGAVFRSNYAG
jgi:polysaccharide pyruvyl transferase WcaK-like protein